MLVIIFFTALSSAFAQSGDFVVFTTDGAALNVALDSKFQNSKATSNLKVTNIPEGDYWVTLLFDDKRKAVKSNVRVLAGKENSFVVDKDGDSWKLKTYSTVPQSQVALSSSSQIRVNYNKEGVTVEGMNSAKELAKSEVEQNPQYVRVHGTLDELKTEAEQKRRGQFSGGVATNEEETATAAPELQEGTTITRRYVKGEGSTNSIVEEITTTTRQIVDRNGQKQMRTKRSMTVIPTDYICMPMPSADFEAMRARVSTLAADQQLTAVQKEIKGACLTTEQLKSLGSLFNKADLELFAMAAQPTAADPNNYPYENAIIAMEDQPVEVVEPIRVEPTVAGGTTNVVTELSVDREEKLITVDTKTKAELRAELKAAKKKEKAERKAAKAKAKAERKAAKAKAKAERG